MLCNLIQVNIRKVHHKVLRHKPFELLGLNHIEFWVIFEAAHELMYSGFVIIPVLFEALDLDLRLGQLLVEFAELFLLLSFFLVHRFLEDFVLCDLAELLHHERVEIVGLFNQDFLYIEEIPIFPNRRQQIIEEIIERILQLFSDFDDVWSQKDFVLLNALTDETAHWLLPTMDLSHWTFHLLLDRLVEIKLVESVQWDHWVQQMRCV